MIEIKSISDVSVTVDYTRSVQELIVAGKFRKVAKEITAENFPIPSDMIGKKVEITGKLVRFNVGISAVDISSEEALSVMDKAGYRPANFMELLTLLASSEWQGQVPIVALGSVWGLSDDDHRVLCFSTPYRDRVLSLSFFDDEWRFCCLFFCIPK